MVQFYTLPTQSQRGHIGKELKCSPLAPINSLKNMYKIPYFKRKQKICPTCSDVIHKLYRLVFNTLKTKHMRFIQDSVRTAL
jgi:hypothetical protein